MIERSRMTIAGFGCCLVILAARQVSLGDSANWATSDLDTWDYENAVSPGTHALAPTFFGGLTVNPSTQQFNPSTVSDPSRLGMVLVAFNTSSKITPGLPANRYQINSVTMKATWTYDSDPNSLFYTNEPVAQSEILNEVSNNTDNRQKPMELYGAGLCAGYTGYEFSGGTAGPPLVDEGTHPYSAPDGGSIMYPIVGSTSQPGAYVDVSNSVTGGYSETEQSHITAPFTPAPWAIGTTDLNVGEAIPDNTTFTFSLNLSAAGVQSYVQQSLKSGAARIDAVDVDVDGRVRLRRRLPALVHEGIRRFSVFRAGLAIAAANDRLHDSAGRRAGGLQRQWRGRHGGLRVVAPWRPVTERD